MKRLILALSAVAMLLAPAIPASARDHGRGGNGTTTTILSGVAGLAVGALATSVIQHRSQARSQTYQRQYQTSGYPQAGYSQTGYPEAGYPSPSYPVQYQRPAYQQPYPSDVPGYDTSAEPSAPLPPAAYHQAAPRYRPAPGGIRCLIWNGEGYAPGRC